MTQAPWYDRYFTADYWAYADAEYTPERTSAEVGYLAGVLGRLAPGRRVLDLGCGVGRHAIGLARLGFEVTGVDSSAYALARARQAAADAGVRLRLHQADLLGPGEWGVPAADAVICVQAFGWGADADQLRLLRTVRRLLPPDGLLVLDHSSVLAIARIYQPQAREEIGGATFDFERSYEPVASRSRGEVRVRRADGSRAVLPDDIRMYAPAEVRALLTRAGYEVAGADADFRSGAPVTIATRYVQFLARPARAVESALAGHRASGVPADVDLRWAPDEADLAAPAIAAAWARATAGSRNLSDLARRYDLTDPYGGARAAPVLAAHLGWPGGTAPSPDRVSVGAGVTGLLHGLARLADGGSVLVAPDGHPQIAEAAAAAGGEVVAAAMTGPAAVLAAVADLRPAVTVIDRPAMTGGHWSLRMIRDLAEGTARLRSVLVVDETCGGYLPPGSSAAQLTDAVPGLVVLRGVSKGYCCGGLRIGFAVAAPGLAADVRAVLAPLAASALSLDVALELLREPDPLAPLRARIAEVKPALLAALQRARLRVIETDHHVPWVALGGDDATRATLAACGLTVKEVPVLRLASGGPGPDRTGQDRTGQDRPGPDRPGPDRPGLDRTGPDRTGPDGSGLLRMSVPLSARRREAATAALALAGDLAAR